MSLAGFLNFPPVGQNPRNGSSFEEFAALFDAELQTALTSLEMKYEMTFHADNGLFQFDASFAETRTFTRVPWDNGAYNINGGGTIPSGDFVVVRGPGIMSLYLANAVSAGLLFPAGISTEFGVNEVVTNGYTSSDTAGCSNTRDINPLVTELTFAPFAGHAGPDIVPATFQCSAFIPVSPAPCVKPGDFGIESLFGYGGNPVTTDPINVTMATLVELIGVNTKTRTVANPDPMTWIAWDAQATVTLTGS